MVLFFYGAVFDVYGVATLLLVVTNPISIFLMKRVANNNNNNNELYWCVI